MTACSPSWPERHDTIRQVLLSKRVRAAVRDFQISHSSVRSICASFQDIDTSKGDAEIESLSLDKLLDISLVITWSAQGLLPEKDPNPFRASASSSLQHLRQASLAVQDFKTVKVLQKSAGSLVEVVKNRLDGRVYVLKSLVKGFARRNAAIQTPVNETKLLQRQSDDTTTTSTTIHAPQLLTPQLLAAFQTQNSVHVLMEYIPSGDFCELLMAASSCGAEYPGRASTGLLIEDWILRYSVDMIQAIAWVHGQGFAHRDIKPGNFLLDKSGHLKLCDFSSAAPFSDFNAQADSRTTERGKHATSSPNRKVWAFYCSQPTGTCDYLSPEVLEAEEQRVLERQRQCDTSSLDDILGLKRQSRQASQNDADTGPKEVPGMYGPEVDWWSFGVMLYEMRFGVLPFFASKMEETYDKIKQHKSSLSFDSSVDCSPQLKSLIYGLLTSSQNRLGRRSTEEVQWHLFYRTEHIDWTLQWPLSPPFAPNADVVDLQSPSAAAQQGGLANGIAAHLQQNGSFSVVSSLPSFSALYDGNPDDFPAFADSREFASESIHQQQQQQDWWEGERTPANGLQSIAQHDESEASMIGASTTAAGALPSGMPRSCSSPAVVLASASQSTTLRDTSSTHAAASSPYMSRSAPRWSDCDTTFIGFSYLPQRDAFSTALEPPETISPGALSTVASMDDLAHKSGASPSGWLAGTPVASTPFHRAGVHSSQSLTMLPTPPSFAPSPVALISSEPGSNHVGTGQADPIRPSARRASEQQSFVTPARKPSFMAMHERFRQLQGQEAPIPEDALATYTPAVPASPYPFPMASVARTSKFTGGKKPLLYRRDLDRARSATPGGGSVGSDSRQSGGSNAVRDMSEREAWDEMMAAVQKSVRKKQPIAHVPPSAAVPATPMTSSAARKGGLPRSSTDPQLSAAKPNATQLSRQLPERDEEEAPISRHASSRRALQPLPAPKQSDEQTEPADQDLAAKINAASQPSIALRQRTSLANLIAPRATFKVIPPESPPQSSDLPAFLNESPHFGPQLALDIDMYDSDASDDSATGRRNLRHKKSARQLLIRAQERGTPTKPKRAQSPALTEAFASAPSVAAVLEAAGARSSPPILLSDQSILSCHSSRDASYEHGADFVPVGTRIRAGSIQRSGKASPDIGTEALSSSLGKTSVTFAPMSYVPVLGAIPPWRDGRDGPGSSDGHGDPLGGPRDTNRSTRTIRRKDSGEMLSQYRNAKGMGRATSMLSLSDRAKADAQATASSRLGSALSSSPPVTADGEDDFILGHVENRMRPTMAGGSLPSRTIRRFSSVLSLKEREKVTVERPASQDGTSKTNRGFGRFRSRLSSSTLCEEPNEELAVQTVKTKPDRLAPSNAVASAIVNGQHNKPASSRLGRKMGDTLPRSFGMRTSSTSQGPTTTSVNPRKSSFTPTLEATQDVDSPTKVADASLMTGLNQRHTALQGSLLGLEARLARLKARLED